MMRTRFSLIGIFAAQLLIGAVLLHAGPTKAPSDELKAYGIGLDGTSLIRALSDPRQKVRGLAAYQLAGEGQTEAVPYLITALRTEKDDNARFKMAQSLFSLGVSEGKNALEQYCLDPRNPENLRYEAARDLGPAESDSCLPAVLPYLRSEDPTLRQIALTYLKSLQAMPAKASPELGGDLIKISTGDQISWNRDLAKDVIRKIGDPATKRALDRALASKSE